MFFIMSYKELVKKVIHEQELVCRAPALSKGDVLFWAAETIHDSLLTTEPTSSRRSFTAHFIPERSRFLQFQTPVKPLRTELINGMRVHTQRTCRRQPKGRFYSWRRVSRGLSRSRKEQPSTSSHANNL